MNFDLESQTKLIQVLLLKFRCNEVKLEHHWGRVTIDSQLLTSVRDQIASKLVAYASDYIKCLNFRGPVS